MIRILPYEERDTEAVIALVLRCQNDGTRPKVGIEDQPELLRIRESYFASGGCFWVAKEEDRVIGSIGLMRCEGGVGILKKFFVQEEYRGRPHHLGRQLYGELLSFAGEHGFAQLILDTPKNTDRAHAFYERAGFVKIAEEALPVQYDYPYAESDFFSLDLSGK